MTVRGTRALRSSIIFAVLAVGAGVLGLSASGPGPATDLHAAENPTIDDPGVVRLCNSCHTLQRVIEAGKSPDEWRNTLKRMRVNGLSAEQMNDAELERIATYLSALLPPKMGGGTGLVKDDLVKAKCTQCHGIELIEAQRKTPEGWNFTVQHMRWLAQKASVAPASSTVQAITKEEGDRIAFYLAQTLPLLPDEKERIEKQEDPKELKLVCGGCHGLETLKTQVKTAEAWDKTLQRMHHFPQGWGYMWGNSYAPVNIAGLKQEDAVKVIRDWLVKNQSFDSDEWKRYVAQGPIDLTGTWRVKGTDSRGTFVGTIAFTSPINSTTYTVARHVEYVDKAAPKQDWTGQAVLFAGASLRISYTWPDPKSIGAIGALDREAPIESTGPVVVKGSYERQKATDQDQFGGSYHFDGIPGQGGSETYTRDNEKTKPGAPRIIAIVPNVIRRGETKSILVVGLNLDPKKPSSLDFGPGVSVKALEQFEEIGGTRSPRFTVAAREDAPLGPHDAVMDAAQGFPMAKLPEALQVVGGIDYLVIEHNGYEWGPVFRDEKMTIPVARLGGARIFAEGPGKEMARVIPKVKVQLRAIAYSNGPDGLPDTADDTRIGPVTASWSGQAVDVTKTRAFNGGDVATGNDAELPADAPTVKLPAFPDPLKYVPNPEKQKSWGSIDKEGLFTPGSEEPRVDLGEGPSGTPIPKTYHTNTGDNRGTVLVTATHTSPFVSVGKKTVEGKMIVVLGPPKWTRWMPYNDAAPGIYNDGEKQREPAKKLSDTPYMAADRIPYDVTTPLWSDGAAKDRTIQFPALPGRNDKNTVGTPVDGWEFPSGTSIVKNFYLGDEKKLVETRVLIKSASGWTGYSYEWDASGKDATLLPGGKDKVFAVTVGGKKVEQTWTYPSRTECFRCHTTAAGGVLGLQTANLSPATVSMFKEKKVFSAEPPPVRKHLVPVEGGGEEAARSYLHVNCSMCHRPGGGTPTSLDLRMNTPLESTGILNTDPKFGDMGVQGAKVVKAGDPKSSVLYLRMTATDGRRMPPLASHVVDEKAAAVIADWIASLK